MRISTGIVAAAALAALFVAPAQALTQASLSGSNFQLLLKDLNAADGVAPSFSWGSVGSLSLGSYEQVQEGWLPVQTNGSYQWTSSSWLPTDFRSAYGTSPSISAVSAFGHGHQSATMDAAGPGSLALDFTVPDGGIQGNSSGGFTRQFTLGAGTEVSFSYTLDVSLLGTGYGAAWAPGSTVDYGSRSSVSFSAFMSAGGHQTNLSSSAYSYWSDPSQPLEVQVDGQVLTLTLKNTDLVARSYSLNLNASIYAMEATAPVPEPASYALMAAGLLAVGAVARRRRAR